MKRIARVAAALLTLGAIVILFALPVLAAAEEEEGAEEGATTTTVAESSGLAPAVEIADEEALEPQQDWTYRYLVPTGLALAVIVVLFTSIRYFTNVVRQRYRIVEE